MRISSIALVVSALCLVSPSYAHDQGAFLRDPANYAKGSFQRQALNAKNTTQAARAVARQFTPRQIERNARAVVTAQVRATESVADWITRRAREAKQYFLRRGWSAKASAAIAGHLIAESAMKTKILGDSGASAGLAQWNGRRLANLRKFAAARGTDWHDFETQLAFIEYELETSETVARDALRKSRNIAEATAAFMHFERPLGYTRAAPRRGHGWPSRLRHAERLYAGYQAEVAALNP